MKKLVLPLAIAAVMDFSCGAGPGSCGKNDVPLPYFNANGIQSASLTIQKADNAFKAYQAGSFIESHDKLLVDLWYSANYYASSSNVKAGFELIPSAYACSPADPGYKGSDEVYKSFTIVSDNNFSPSLAAGTVLNNLFEIRNEDYKYVPLSTASLSGTSLKTPYMSLRLIQQPTSVKRHRFKISVELTNGEKYEKFTEDILFR